MLRNNCELCNLTRIQRETLVKPMENEVSNQSKTCEHQPRDGNHRPTAHVWARGCIGATNEDSSNIVFLWLGMYMRDLAEVTERKKGHFYRPQQLQISHMTLDCILLKS